MAGPPPEAADPGSHDGVRTLRVRREAPGDEFDFLDPEPAGDLKPDESAEPDLDDQAMDGSAPSWLARSAAALGVGHARFDPGRRGVRTIAVVAILAAVVIGVVAWQLRPVTDPVPAPAANVAGSAAPAASATQLVVSVAGRVRHPGLVRLPAGGSSEIPTPSRRHARRLEPPAGTGVYRPGTRRT